MHGFFSFVRWSGVVDKQKVQRIWNGTNPVGFEIRTQIAQINTDKGYRLRQKSVFILQICVQILGEQTKFVPF